MKKPLLLTFLVILSIIPVFGQKARRNPMRAVRAVVIETRLAVVRDTPGFFGKTVRRVRRGRELSVTGSRFADGARFLRVALSSRTAGWIQREAVAIRGDASDDARLFRLVLTARGFDQIDAARIHLNEFPASANRARMLLLFGDLAEQAAAALSVQIAKRLDGAEMSVIGGPLHGYLLNYSGLDRYRRIGIVFFADREGRRLHYSGTAWRELIRDHGATTEATEARGRLEALGRKLTG
jgi:hypothetical protein